MQQTLVVVFDNRSDAQKAMEELVACGYPREQLRLSEGDPVGDASGAAAASGADDRTFTSGIRHFFSDLFGGQHSESARMYSEAVARGNYVLTLTAGSLPEVERAADIVARFGPIDIDEHAGLWGGAPGADAAIEKSQPGSQQLARPDAVQGSAQRTDSKAIPVIQEELKVGKRQLARGGVRIYQRVVEEVVVGKEVQQRQEQVMGTLRRTEVEVDNLAPDDEAYFRGHWSSNYAGQGGSYDDYAPAYTYGSTMATSELYRGRPWHDVESHLRSNWEARNPDSAWEKMKAAIRHGWERMTS